MADNVTSDTDMFALMYTTHGTKRPQGLLAIVNSRVALAYVKGKGDKTEVEGFTYLDEIMQKACTTKLPEYHLEA